MFDLNLGLSVWTTFVFLALLGILWKYAWGPVLDAVNARESGIQDTLDGIWGKADGDGEPGVLTAVKPAHRADDEPLSPYQFAKKVERVVEVYVRPMLQKDGGDVEIVDIKDLLVYCQLQGACHGCAGATMTLKLMIEKTLKERVDDRIRVIQL